jgi:hypothetical protein
VNQLKAKYEVVMCSTLRGERSKAWETVYIDENRNGFWIVMRGAVDVTAEDGLNKPYAQPVFIPWSNIVWFRPHPMSSWPKGLPNYTCPANGDPVPVAATPEPPKKAKE